MNRTVVQAACIAAATSLIAGCAPAATIAVEEAPLDRSVMPAPGPEPEVDFPGVRRSTLSNGLTVWVVERPEVPLVTAQLLFEAGARMDPPGQSGLSSLTAEMLTEGTTTRSATEIADEIDFLAANLSAGVGRETAVVTLTTLARNVEPALELFTDIVANPSFDEDEWARVRDQRLVSLLQALDQPATIASQEFARIVFGLEHPYGRPVQGTTESVSDITPTELREFHRTYYRPAEAHLIVVGAVETDDLVQQLETHFSAWLGSAPPAPAGPADPPPAPTTQIYLIDKPGAAQSQIRIGHVGVDRMHEDYFPLLALNSILGGQFSSRINLNLREDKGYTYGASSSFQMGRIAGPFVAGAGVQTAVTMESIVEFMRELKEIRDQRPATPEEVEFATTSIIRQEPLTLQTNAQIAARVQDLIRYDLPLDYFDEYSDRVAEVSVAEVNRAAREHLRPGQFAIVVVGDRATIEQNVRTLPYPVEIVAIEGQAEPVTERQEVV
ncbi:MAG: pitrilysin family protein, partial [Gemmatimonadota bacterium]